VAAAIGPRDIDARCGAGGTHAVLWLRYDVAGVLGSITSGGVKYTVIWTLSASSVP
jgi:hypothetical protein